MKFSKNYHIKTTNNYCKKYIFLDNTWTIQKIKKSDRIYKDKWNPYYYINNEVYYKHNQSIMFIHKNFIDQRTNEYKDICKLQTEKTFKLTKLYKKSLSDIKYLSDLSLSQNEFIDKIWQENEKLKTEIKDKETIFNLLIEDYNETIEIYNKNITRHRWMIWIIVCMIFITLLLLLWI